VAPDLIVEYPAHWNASLSEATAASHAVTIRIKLTTPSVAPVLVQLIADSQVNLSVGLVNFSGSDSNSYQEVTVHAVDDASYESNPHFATIVLDVMSDDPRYHLLPVSPISLGIVDNDCPEIRPPLHGSLLACSNTHGTSCSVLCESGHFPSGPVHLVCKAEGSRWDRPAPTCETCLDQHYRAGTRCRPCSTSLCPPGRYRGRSCAPERDSICDPCPNFKPQHADWHSECIWQCKPGYLERNGTCNPLPAPRIILAQPLPSVSESKPTPSSIQLGISRQPSADVVMSVHNTDGQLQFINGRVHVFTPEDWLETRNVSVVAVDDTSEEGPHSGWLLFSLSSSDPLYDGLSYNVSLSVSDNDCAAARAPAFGTIVSCASVYGGICVFQCDRGRHPEGNVTSRCLQSGTWSREPPVCDACVEGFYKDGNRCNRCSVGTCAAGYFRTGCTANTDSQCVPCSAALKPPHSRFVTPGQPATRNNCRWACEVNHHQVGTTCVPCPQSPCRAGYYRSKCATLGTQEDTCVSCNGTMPLPDHAEWIAGVGAFNCTWQCRVGFDRVGRSCIVGASRSLVIDEPGSPWLAENSASTPAQASIQLSHAPLFDVTIVVTVSDQITLTTPAQLVFSPTNWNVPQTISVLPIDDTVYEGDHAGIVFFQNITSADPSYVLAQSHSVAVPIRDNDCPALEAPSHGILSSCSRSHGGTCTVTCNSGLDPVFPVVLMCLPAGRWNSSVPTCTKCAHDHFLDGDECKRCSETPCGGVGTYRSACTLMADSQCSPCTAKPANAHFTASAQPLGRDECAWSCDSGFYKSGAQCVPCDRALCMVGQYRSSCSADANSICAPCTNFKPTNSHFTSHGGESNDCRWACDGGFEKASNGSSCQPVPFAALLITPIHLQTWEEAGATPAAFQVSLSRAPIGPVVCNLLPQDQLQSCTPERITYSATTYGPVTVYCTALTDEVSEGRHVGTVLVSVESSADLEFDRLVPSTVTINIEEVRCPARADQGNYHVLGCNRTIGGICELACKAGFAPASPVVSECISHGSGSPRWTHSEPACISCLANHYRNGSDCLPCTRSSCPVGQYRGACAAPQGGDCRPCTNPLPAFAHYTSAGNPYDSNNCNWDCNNGYFMNNGSTFCSTERDPGIQVHIDGARQRFFLDTAEDPGSAPAAIEIALAQAPSETVTISLVDLSVQLHVPALPALVFTTSNWNVPIRIEINAVDDSVFEGQHSGHASLRSSSLDPNYEGLQTDISITIADNDCPPLPRPGNGAAVTSCTQTSTRKFCDVLCNSGYAFANNMTRATLTCDKISGAWDQQVEPCASCAVGYFNSSRSCQQCSTRHCPAGQYRGKCKRDQDAVCLRCMTPKPAHSHFIAGGSPFNADNCSWTCDVGYVARPAALSNVTTFVCEKLPGVDVRNDPTDSDQDGIPDLIEGSDNTDTDHDG